MCDSSERRVCVCEGKVSSLLHTTASNIEQLAVATIRIGTLNALHMRVGPAIDMYRTQHRQLGL